MTSLFLCSYTVYVVLYDLQIIIIIPAKFLSIGDFWHYNPLQLLLKYRFPFQGLKSYDILNLLVKV